VAARVTGAAGQALAAVLAYEDDDSSRVTVSGHAVYDVSRAYLAALSGAMTTLETIADRP